jgi:hypothetical protein
MPRKTTSQAARAAKSKPESAAPQGDDHREFHRYTFRGRANAVIFPKDKSGVAEEWEVVTTDVSRGGVSIMHRKHLANGQQVMLVLNDAKRFVEVCWCCQVWQGLYAAGCRFLDEPAPGLMNYLMATDDR